MIRGVAMAALVVLFGVMAFRESVAPSALAQDRWVRANLVQYHALEHRFGAETFSARGEPFDDAGWLADTIAGSLPARSVPVLNGLLCTVALSLAAFALRNRPLAIAATAVACVGVATAGGWADATLGFSLVMATAFFELLRRSDERAVWWTIPLTAAWCNFSVSGLLAPLFAFVVTVASLRDGPAQRLRLRRLFALTIALAAATLCTPAGIHLPLNAAAHLGFFDKEIEALTQWQPQTRPIALFFGFVPLVVLLAWSGAASARGSRDAGLALCGLAVALSSVRFLPLAAVALALVVACAWERAYGAPRRLAATFMLATAGCAAFAVAIRTPAPVTSDLAGALAVAELQTQGARHLFCTTPAWCNYALGGPAAVFIDTRVSSYPPDRRRDAGTVSAAEVGWRKILQRWRIDGIVVGDDRPLASLLALDAHWIAVHDRDGVAAFVRRT